MISWLDPGEQENGMYSRYLLLRALQHGAIDFVRRYSWSGGRQGGAVTRVVCVHGVAQQYEAVPTLHATWAPALCGGVELAGGRLAEDAVRCVLYGNLFRSTGRHLAVGDPLIRPEDLDEFEQNLLAAWWAGAADTDPGVISPDARTLAGTPRSAQAALRALSRSKFFAAIGERALLGDLRQVRDYLHAPDIRRQAIMLVAEAIDDDTRVLVGHSLGSVVAYEALCAHPDWPVRKLVTLGAPLGIPNLIFDQLVPAPLSESEAGSGSRGRWPGEVRAWANIADEADVVALVKDLRPLFGAQVAHWVVDNGAHAHSVKPYLTAVETGLAIWTGLEER